MWPRLLSQPWHQSLNLHPGKAFLESTIKGPRNQLPECEGPEPGAKPQVPGPKASAEVGAQKYRPSPAFCTQHQKPSPALWGLKTTLPWPVLGLTEREQVLSLGSLTLDSLASSNRKKTHQVLHFEGSYGQL